MHKLRRAAHSRTVLTVHALFLINDVEPLKAVLPASWMPFFNVILAMAARYFRLNPREATRVGYTRPVNQQ